MGSRAAEVRQKAYRLGEAIAERDAILITGACPGLPYEAVRGAKAKGGRLIGILTGTGGITQIVEEIIRVSGKDTGECVLYDEDPGKTEHHRKPSCFCEARSRIDAGEEQRLTAER